MLRKADGMLDVSMILRRFVGFHVVMWSVLHTLHLSTLVHHSAGEEWKRLRLLLCNGMTAKHNGKVLRVDGIGLVGEGVGADLQ